MFHIYVKRIYFLSQLGGMFCKCLLSIWSIVLFKSWRRKSQPSPILLPGNFHGWRSLVGYSPWGRKESYTSNFTFFLSVITFGEGNGNALQCFCLENPMDRGTWWATVYGVAKSQTHYSNPLFAYLISV